MANMSAIYEYLGARADQIPILWLAAPLTGLIVQPIIGHASDRTWGPLGRRRPYFLTGAILSSTALILMPRSSPFAWRPACCGYSTHRSISAWNHSAHLSLTSFQRSSVHADLQCRACSSDSVRRS